jgi:amidase
LLEGHRDETKDTVVWTIEEGARPSGSQIGQAERKRTELFHRVRIFMEPYELLVSPVSRPGVTQRVSAACAVRSQQGR